MKTKHFILGATIGIILLTSTNLERTSKLEKSIQTTPVMQTTNPNILPAFPEPNDPNKNPNEYDSVSNMKAIIEPRDEIYDLKKTFK